jgi:hypothetical protein
MATRINREQRPAPRHVDARTPIDVGLWLEEEQQEGEYEELRGHRDSDLWRVVGHIGSDYSLTVD